MDAGKTSAVYRTVSIVILAVCIYFFLLPVISPFMERMLPEIWTCPFLRITGNPCPFCGITRGMGSIYSLDIGSASTIALMAALIAVSETAFRILIVTFAGSMKGRTIENASDFAMYLLEEAQVATVTGEAFGSPNCIRISYAASEDEIREAIRRIREAL